MEQNQRREKLAWLAIITVILMLSFGMFRLADMAAQWLASDDADRKVAQQLAEQRPAPARGYTTIPADIQQHKQQQQSSNPGGWAGGQFDLEFIPGPAFKNEYEDLSQPPRQSSPTTPAPKAQEPQQKQPQYRKRKPDESMEEFWEPDYYKDGLDL